MQTCRKCGNVFSPQARFCSWCGTPASPNKKKHMPTGLLPAHSLLRGGRYLILERVGKGGMAAVYKAQDTQLHPRLVAIKEMSQEGLSGQALQIAIEAFMHEAEMLARLKHPGLPHIYEQFEEEQRRYLVMEFIEGETLEQRLEAIHRQGKRLPVDQALAIGKQLCTVLDYLHAQQPPVIFRDLKPANIMLNKQGQVYLIDFGIARLLKPGQTKDTIALGSPGYAPPEQYRRATSPRSDIYSLGATLHQMLTGKDPSQTPFYFQPFSLNMPRLEQLVLSMVALNEQQRPDSMRLILDVLNNPNSTTGQTSPSPRSLQQQPPRPVRNAQAVSTPASTKRSFRANTPVATKVPSLSIYGVVSAQSQDVRLWQDIQQQLTSLIDGFPSIPMQIDVNGQAVKDAGLTLLMLSEDFLASPSCIDAANHAIDQQGRQETSVLAIMLRPCSLAGSRLDQLRSVPEDAVNHLSLYAREQRMIEVAKTIRSLLVPLVLEGKNGGPMNLLQWLIWQLYGNGYAACRHFLVGHYTLQHLRPAGLAGILLHLTDQRKRRMVGEYLIGPLRCQDLTKLLHTLAPATTDPATVQGVATRQRQQV